MYFRGYYPKGGGEVHLKISPIKNLTSIEMLHQGNIESISGWAYVAGSIHLNVNIALNMQKDLFLLYKFEY